MAAPYTSRSRYPQLFCRSALVNDVIPHGPAHEFPGIPIQSFPFFPRFHVDKLSSAHVYLRLHKGQTMDDIPKEVLSDCAHLVKANSIQGIPKSPQKIPGKSLGMVENPRKSSWERVGKSLGIHLGGWGKNRKKVRTLTVERRPAEQLRRLERTRVERFPDLAAERECRDREERGRRRQQLQELRRAEREELRRKKELEELRSYSSLMKAENMSSNQVSIPGNSGNSNILGAFPEREELGKKKWE
ncbi:PREDICTED: coiled-coil domain-containing protein 25 [Sturnus vulgaris]|uniref:coiled-coil domain-containing protein 25 n=1 Tax=Sturnus vulgaris TaxID=9172 RepID=UPI00071A6E06|nr:PREDICTED: coiled-coil domain-containing protein 25 [Sturnus vulgaris]